MEPRQISVLRHVNIAALRSNFSQDQFAALRTACRRYVRRHFAREWALEDVEDIVSGAISDVLPALLSSETELAELDRLIANALHRRRVQIGRLRQRESELSGEPYASEGASDSGEILAFIRTLEPIFFESMKVLSPRDRFLLVHRYSLEKSFPLEEEVPSASTKAARAKAVRRARMRFKTILDKGIASALLHPDAKKAALELVHEADVLELVGVLPDLVEHPPGTRLLQGEGMQVLPRLVQECSRELMSWLARHPEDLYRVHAGTFERIIAEIFRGEGFDVDFVSAWNQEDGGVDLLAVRRVAGNTDIRLAIQCKRYSYENRVSAEPMRSLNGILDRFRAHAGVVATTSFFTDDAREEVRRHLWRISLRDYDEIRTALRRWGGYRFDNSGLWLRE